MKDKWCCFIFIILIIGLFASLKKDLKKDLEHLEQTRFLSGRPSIQSICGMSRDQIGCLNAKYAVDIIFDLAQEVNRIAH